MTGSTQTSPSRPVFSERIRQSLVGPQTLRLAQVVGIASCGLAVDIAWFSGPASIGSALAVLVAAGVVLQSRRLVSRSAKWMAAAAPVFATALCLRTSAWLVPLNLVAAWGLLVAAAVFSQRGRLHDMPAAAWVRQGVRIAFDTIDAVPMLNRTVRTHARDADVGLWRSIGLGLLLAVPMVLLLGGLLVSGDAVFASVLFGLPIDSAAGHLFALLLGAFAALALLRAASGKVDEPEFAHAWLRPATTGVLLGALVLLYGVYALVTAVAALEGPGAFLEDPAAVAEWARTGFFQLLAVAGLTLTILISLRSLTHIVPGRTGQWISLTATIAVALTEVIVIAAVARIWAYSVAYGLTMLRLYSALFAVWVAIVFVLLLIRFWSVRSSSEWLPMGAALAGLAMLVVLDCANPEAHVVRWNLDRRDEVERFDVGYLAGLSDDALPALRDGFGELSPGEREAVRQTVCGRHGGGSWLGWNLSAQRGGGARDGMCPNWAPPVPP